MKINLFIVGAMKCGTTTLSDFLNNSKDYYAPNKEGHLFYTDVFNADKIRKYEALCSNIKWFADKTPTYGVFDESPRLIYEYNPDAKIIWILRDPINRALSHVVHAQKTGAEFRSAEQCMSDEMNGKVRDRSLAYLLRSDYPLQIKKYERIFGQDKILVIKYEDFVASKEHVFQQISEFLDIRIDAKWAIPYSNRSFYPKYYRVNKYVQHLPKRRFLMQVIHMLLPKLRQPEVLSDNCKLAASDYLRDSIRFWDEL